VLEHLILLPNCISLSYILVFFTLLMEIYYNWKRLIFYALVVHILVIIAIINANISRDI